MKTSQAYIEYTVRRSVAERMSSQDYYSLFAYAKQAGASDSVAARVATKILKTLKR